MSDLSDLYTAVVEMEESVAAELSSKYLDEGTPALEIFKVYQNALEEIGKRYEEKKYFIPELIMAGAMMSTSAEKLKPYLTAGEDKKGGEKKLGKVLIATVEGDIHDIGKNIVTMMLDLNGFEVRDIGVDVPAEKIIAEAEDFGASVIGLSGLLTLAFDPMKDVVETLEKQGVRNKFKVLIGGGQMDEQVCKYVGADAFVTDAVQGVNFVKEWMN